MWARPRLRGTCAGNTLPRPATPPLFRTCTLHTAHQLQAIRPTHSSALATNASIILAVVLPPCTLTHTHTTTSTRHQDEQLQARRHAAQLAALARQHAHAYAMAERALVESHAATLAAALAAEDAVEREAGTALAELRAAPARDQRLLRQAWKNAMAACEEEVCLCALTCVRVAYVRVMQCTGSSCKLLAVCWKPCDPSAFFEQAAQQGEHHRQEERTRRLSHAKSLLSQHRSVAGR